MPIQITISFGPGYDVAGVVLSLTGAGLRVVLPDWEDTAEFQCRHGQWFLENRDPVDISWPKHAASSGSLAAGRLCIEGIDDSPRSIAFVN